jgi:bifunctional polynucleotide phosphatase/kinase
MPGMWDELERIFAADNVQIGEWCRDIRQHREYLTGVTSDKDTSFFVGDAAGRAGDFASTDRKWAVNIGIRFYTPEVSIKRPTLLVSC